MSDDTDTFTFGTMLGGPDPVSVMAVETSEIVQTFLRQNSISTVDATRLIPGLVRDTMIAFRKGAGDLRRSSAPDIEPRSDDEIADSIKADALISFIDGKRYKTLKRHLSKHGMTGDQYRSKFGLPDDYPLVAPSYREQRSMLAKRLGLGKKGPIAEAA